MGSATFVLAEPQACPAGRTEAGQVWVIFGQTDFAATFDLASLNGSNGFTVYGKTASDSLGSSSWERPATSMATVSTIC